MADENGAAQSAQTWPVPEFHFSVDITDVGKISCKEVSGLDIEFDVIEYRSGDMPGFTKVKMPGLRKSGDVTLKKAMFTVEGFKADGNGVSMETIVLAHEGVTPA